MRMCSIASGSSGNCIYVGNESTHILVDAGISGKRIEAGLNSLDLTLKDIDAILITHEHSDHIQGLGVISRKAGIPVYATKGTIEGIKKVPSLGKIDDELLRTVDKKHSFIINDITISPMEISHDANEPAAFRFGIDDKNVAIATDLGFWDEQTVEDLTGMDFLFLEANHDVRMLETGRYPWPTKQRILGDKGHLSNENCGRLLSRLIHYGLSGVMLGHLSKDNNIPELAYETVRCEVTMSGGNIKRIDFPIMVAKRDDCSDLISL